MYNIGTVAVAGATALGMTVLGSTAVIAVFGVNASLIVAAGAALFLTLVVILGILARRRRG